MITIERCLRLLDSNFSLVTLGIDKRANYTWKNNQQTIISKDEFKIRYNYEGGIFYTKKGTTEKTELAPTENIGLITGYNNLEVIDVDLKVFPTLPQQQNFWNELYNCLKDNIDDFDLKFVIYKTKNQGYHILYRCNTIAGNEKIAKLEGHKECVIESRGVGGYVVIYENKISKLEYLDIQLISEKDRCILWDVCRSYNFVAPTIEPEETKLSKAYSDVEITPWQDYNARVSIFDIVGDEFNIVSNLTTHYIILRHGAKSAHSGYIYKNSGCMYLFSTGTIYPNEKLITPFLAYTIKYHNGNFKASAADLYHKGYGSRMMPKKQSITQDIKIEQKDIDFPIDIYPIEIQNYIIECNKTLDSSIDYMGCTMLWQLSVIIGNSIQIEVKKGWYEIANVWIAIVGKAGLGKTPSIHNIIYPLQKVNSRRIKEYIKNYERFEHYEKLTKEEKKQHEEVKKPIKQQFIANDITLEALVALHQDSKNAVGVFKDELAGWFKDMNKYRAGSDLEFWLSTWSGKSVSMNRKTASSVFVDKPLIPVLGGIQPNVLQTFYTEENKDNGFVDRMLLTDPDLKVVRYNSKDIDPATIQWYENAIVAFYEYVINNFLDYTEDYEILPKTAKLSKAAKTEWERIFNEITEIQNSDDENEYMKSMLPKQKSYIPRFALLLHVLEFFMNSESIDPFQISKESMLKAEKLSKYFIAMAKKIKVNSLEMGEIKQVMYNHKNKSKREQFMELYNQNNELNRTKVGETLGVSRMQISRWIREFSNE
jgi:hypothetical protein